MCVTPSFDIFDLNQNMMNNGFYYDMIESI